MINNFGYSAYKTMLSYVRPAVQYPPMMPPNRNFMPQQPPLFEQIASFNPWKEKTATAAQDVRQSFTQVKEASSTLNTTSKNNIFDVRKADVSNSNVLGVQASNRATVGTYKIEVSQVATAKQTTSNTLRSNDLQTMQAGTQSFGLQVGGVTKNVSVNFSSLDTNLGALNKVARAVNDAKAGVTARVVESTTDGVRYSKLVLTADKTGTANAFTLTAGSGDLLTATQMNHQTTEARNAKYSVDGKDYEQASNTVQLDNGKVTATLKGVTTNDNPVTVTVDRDRSAIIKQVSALIEEYNQAIVTMQDQSGLISNRVMQRFTQFANDREEALDDIGITVQADNQLSLDQSKLDRSLQNNYESTKNLIGGAGGLAPAMERRTSNLLNSPVTALIQGNNDVQAQQQQMASQLNQYLLFSQPNRFYAQYASAGGSFNFFL
ncbi:flagellar filament capping protein FliD [Heliophilum fasciatum]|uniref:Flagellar hook-associated protein 2 n=1 Tax=Heliophilum fasciatum TaxID=35700 RepID=A0A4R2RL92_9FIRM|nr:flagellar filament capping protein FliD [Heliophilum fasciatum]MCW2278397.1 flagellar hook-associated protein 2 [Heliophilum fasciatum]TCP63704.1 flagellar hook-associated protein 2 [Heliophilum fasciatum]